MFYDCEKPQDLPKVFKNMEIRQLNFRRVSFVKSVLQIKSLKNATYGRNFSRKLMHLVR